MAILPGIIFVFNIKNLLPSQVEIITVLAYLTIVMIILSLLILSSLSGAEQIETSQPSSEPLVSIIIPARNEEHNIRQCLQSLIDLDYNHTEIIVVDGNSTDGTRDIVREFSDNVILVEEPETPDKWIGKSWACHTGKAHASGDILLFTDADTIHSPASLSTMVDQHVNNSQGFTTLITTQVLTSFIEKVLLFVFFIGIVSLGGLRQKESYAFANGQYMMFSTKFYDSLGEHGAYYEVRDQIVDDFALGSLMARQGITIHIVQYTDLVRVRMYHSFAEIRDGFTKNLASGASALGAAGFIRSNIIINWAFLAPLLIIVTLLIDEILIFPLITGIVGYFLFVIVLFGVEKNATGNVSYAPLIYPIYLLIYQYIVFRSFYMSKVTKEVTWKGRSYSTS